MTVPVTARRPPLQQHRLRGGTRPAGKTRGAWARRAPLLPALVFLIVVTQLPFVGTLVISFMRWNALDPGNRGFGGLANYKAAITDPDLRSSIVTTVVLTATVVLVSLLLGLGLSLLLDRQFRGRGIVRTMLITPFLVVPVASALLWKHALYNASYGLIDGTLTWIWSLFGSSNAPQPDWLSTVPLISVEASLIWQWTPFMMLILLAGLQSRPLDIVEAARMDGAGTWQVFRYLTFPHLRRYLELAALLGSIYVVQNFDAVFTLTSGGLGTANLPYTVYETFYQAHDYGQASAEGVIVVACSILIATFALRTVSSLFREETL
ncbi:sugar ABC transporter permease [Actinacidiphila oryziradicis]|jgi:sorbitol/mannitol transport system permease protein|uniref:Sugar ABC transporter permease n=1 Tax=Actinacidiphila oryziradicis TaxID=2571141 RepID=A0A4U0SJI3_9ACTN|nr:sugar ABC transporter permease [Actinacidiphila oryziradicis]MCW2869850.1 transporter permease [Actinacidiphila oryziradicis]TKA08211.1 sugar ABC transporter permease [Actinacidiphila oryziradicis]